ncbi:Arrestin homolog [Gryllus bimaculatus]|nr:Arrestin homolog [Gryllus bimaculatus]
MAGWICRFIFSWLCVVSLVGNIVNNSDRCFRAMHNTDMMDIASNFSTDLKICGNMEVDGVKINYTAFSRLAFLMQFLLTEKSNILTGTFSDQFMWEELFLITFFDSSWNARNTQLPQLLYSLVATSNDSCSDFERSERNHFFVLNVTKLFHQRKFVFHVIMKTEKYCPMLMAAGLEGDPASPGQARPGPAVPAATEPAAAPPASPDMDDASSRRQATRVFKKSSPNGKITVYLGKRDFVDHITHVDPIDGVVLIDPEYVKDRKVFGHVLAAFRYGREDLDVLGLTFRKDLYLAAEQIFPLIQPEGGAAKRPLTRLQERLIKKLGPNAYPFYFELPPHCPASVTLQPAPGDTGKPCGVDYELKAFVGETQEDKPHKRNSVRLAIRKIMYAPSKQGEQPSVEVSKEFMMSPNKLHLEASLDKELYHHGENIAVNVHIANNSNRTVKKIKVSVRQFADICLFSTAQYKCTVAETESEEGCPIGPGFTLSKVFVMTPLLANNKDKWGLALDGQLKHEDTNLASSTLVADPSQRENLGIIVQYKVKVKLCLGALGGDLAAELPFILMHPKPEEEPPLPPTARPSPSHAPSGGADDVAVDTNLIQLDTDGILPDQDDDIIFEDFARLRLKGETDA